MAVSYIKKIVIPAQRTLSTDYVTKDNISVEGSGAGELSISVKKTGYTALGIVGISCSNATSDGTGYGHSCINRFYLDSSSNAIVRIKNTSTNAIKIKLVVRTLYVSN